VIASPARELAPAGWRLIDDRGASAAMAADGRPETAWQTDGPQRAGAYVQIDLGELCALHRVYLTPGAHATAFPRGITVWVRESTNAWRQAVSASLPRSTETDLRFNPVTGRHVRIELTGDGAGYPWAIAELLLYATPPTPRDGPHHGVIVRSDAPVRIRQAAQDLRYALMELLDEPVVLRGPAEDNDLTGLRCEVQVPASYHETYSEYLRDPRRAHPERIRVTRDGERVEFNGVTERGVMYAVYEFLHRQGVRWLYPDALGEYVPTGAGVNLDVLPLTGEPDFTRRYANWNIERHEADPERYLWYYRSRWNSTWGGELNDRPGEPTPASTPQLGYTHTFAGIVRDTDFAEHPDWFPLFREPRWLERIGRLNMGRRVPYDTTYGLNFCTSNTGTIARAVSLVLDGCHPDDVDMIAWLTPMDAGAFCECDSCRALDDPDQPNTGPWPFERVSHTPRYMAFIGEVASRVARARPNVKIGAFAYEGYIDPPERLARLPDNVVVDVIQYGIYNLPLNDPSNAWARAIMEGWNRRWEEPGHVGVYDWSLLSWYAHGKPLPMVTALADRVRTWHALGVRRIGTQADAKPEYWRRNPWNFYAYGRLTWDAETPAEALLQDFFHGYFREAAEPMLAYYRALEDHLLSNHISLGPDYRYDPPPAAYPPALLDTLRAHMRDARNAATHWVTRQRVADIAAGHRAIIDGS
jgi:hypothetical protein